MPSLVSGYFESERFCRSGGVQKENGTSYQGKGADLIRSRNRQ
jgi:hypothetical protein